MTEIVSTLRKRTKPTLNNLVQDRAIQCRRIIAKLLINRANEWPYACERSVIKHGKRNSTILRARKLTRKLTKSG